MSNHTNIHKVVIGRADEVDFVDLDIFGIPAKVDTGAYHSVLHAQNVKLNKDGSQLEFIVLGGHAVFGDKAVLMKTNRFERVNVMNSFGHSEDRYEIELKVRLGTKTFRSAFTLNDRSKLVFPVLLGRKALNRRFLVDTSLTGIDRLALKERYNIVLPNRDEEGEEA